MVIVLTVSKGGANGEVKNSQMSSKNVALSAAIAGIVAVALIGAAIFIPGAGIFGPSSSGTLGIQLTDPPTLPPGVTAVYITYSEMYVHVADAGTASGWYPVAPASEINLMSVVNTSITLGSAKVKTGVFNMVAFNITSATVTVNGKNESAFISSNKLMVPLVGDLRVDSGANVGVLVDLSPTVMAVENGNQTAYVLIPSAHGLHIPDSAWKEAEHQGDEIQNIQQQTWYEDEFRGQISITAATLSANSLSVTVKNTGTNNTVVSSLSVYYPLSVICTQYLSGQCTATTSGGDYPHGVPVAQFAVLANGSLVQYNFTAAAIAHYTSESSSTTTTTTESSTTSSSTASEETHATTSSTTEAEIGANVELYEQQGVHLGYVLAPGQSVTFTFSGKVATISPDILNYLDINVAVPSSLINALSTINSGQIYLVTASGPFDTFAYTQITAS